MSAVETKAISLARRRSQVFVEIPYSSLTARLASSPLCSTISRTRSASRSKENAPSSASERKSRTTMATDISTASKKRKSAEEDDELTESSTSSRTKKAKLSASAPQPAGKAKEATKTEPQRGKEIDGSEQVEDFPNGYFYCHQCCRKRDASVGVHCTWKRANIRSKGELERCNARYCRACLKNRYRMDMDTVLSRGITGLSLKEREQHDLHDGYYYQCPRCQDNCNCRKCRKAKGLEPTGNFNLAARKAEKAAASEKVKKEAVSSSKAKQSNTRKSGKAKQPNKIAESSKSAKPRAKAKTKAPPVKPLPKPIWTRVATDLTLDEAESRIHIREFVVRFASVLQIPLGHLEELDEISGDNLGETLEWDGHHTDCIEIVSWVSELCAKEIIQGLLDVLAGSAEARGDNVDAEALKEAAKTVKASGANLNRTWAALLTLRESLGDRSSVTFSDPSPPPASTLIRTTRQNRDLDIMHISISAQLIPVIVDLIEAAISSPAIRDALEAGSAEEKEYGKLAREAIATENNRWKESKEYKDAPNAKKGETKAARDHHHQTIEDLESAHRLLLLRCISRVSPLGRDIDGRIYYAMTPGAGESIASINLLKGKDGRVKVGRKKGGFTEEDRKEMERWTWFIAVWGRKPEGALEEMRDADEDDEASEGESDEECWWGFWHPQEIQKMAEWLSVKSGLEDSASKVTNAVVSKANGSKNSGSAKGKGSRSRTSTATSSLSSLSTHASPLSAISDMSDLSDDEATNDVDLDRPLGHKREVQDLVSGLKQYADLLKWRIKRASPEISGKSGKNAAKTQAIPPNRFYS
ncbi:hypothetical protein BDY19DRAFT_967488 [Irpex rosettiformis]|uniref:Uncharacterized protein n=1 Tax=Irpex rosettiformis TaxID=378272 RepID=A0ACB8TT09_9APHY|nr:hypothetical protein BDY19DRAFT_967488 [Irpex rosettiformis]